MLLMLNLPRLLSKYWVHGKIDRNKNFIAGYSVNWKKDERNKGRENTNRKKEKEKENDRKKWKIYTSKKKIKTWNKNRKKKIAQIWKKDLKKIEKMQGTFHFAPNQDLQQVCSDLQMPLQASNDPHHLSSICEGPWNKHSNEWK